MAKQLTLRQKVLFECGASGGEAQELLAYNEQHFDRSQLSQLKFPLPDERFVTFWEQYSHEVNNAGTIQILERHLVQLRFPVRHGMSLDPDYIAATRRGSEPSPQVATGLQWHEPHRCRVLLHTTPAGRIPVLEAGAREDFILLVQALTKRNEPVPILDSMGACMVSGYRNWDRIRPLEGGSLADPLETLKDKSNYQDRFIIVSSNYYSGVLPAHVGLSPRRWLDLSLVIRREHECAHYFTRRVFSSMRNNLIDEIIADYCGIVAALGYFRSEWMLRFFGLEEFPSYRSGGRLENYRGSPELTLGAFRILQILVKRAAENLAVFDSRIVTTHAHPFDFLRCILLLSTFTLEELAADSAPEALFRSFVEQFGGSISGLPVDSPKQAQSTLATRIAR